ncbi:MAG: cupredoxin domain-containing protein [Chloroflexi bacterium]|nr:cupredoxin domain-containing protein [Chloroflexota bacterium]
MTRRSRATRLAGQPPAAGHRAATPPESRPGGLQSRPLRLAAFATIALVVGGLAIGLVVSRLQGPGGSDVAAIQVHASMGGFDPPGLTVKAGQAVQIELSSMDSSFHSDGGGWHELAIDALGIDWKVGPQSSKVFGFTAPATAGTYTFYCNICCGGKENPSMVGKLTVTA